MPIKFSEVRPTRVIAPGQDAISVNTSGIRIAASTYTRMGYPETIKVEISEDQRVVRLSVPGPFLVRNYTDKIKRTETHAVYAATIAKMVPKGWYRHTSENLFVRE